MWLVWESQDVDGEEDNAQNDHLKKRTQFDRENAKARRRQCDRRISTSSFAISRFRGQAVVLGVREIFPFRERRFEKTNPIL